MNPPFTRTLGEGCQPDEPAGSAAAVPPCRVPVGVPFLNITPVSLPVFFYASERSKSPLAAIMNVFISGINSELKNYIISAASLQKAATPPLRGLFCGVASRINRLALRRLKPPCRVPVGVPFFLYITPVISTGVFLCRRTTKSPLAGACARFHR